ncbi:AMP-dependent synthetase/ligase [Arsenicicoccus sp. oral taxon 190]|uniref:AMP-dependent synthetase/ligase n=1 Tax=Arsenicicoccus sp. oral taxon 190 TaxID=1658671 RepID=UPI00067A254E|nr:AMP-binding protein [Arsenicicoccus sp. oral taxon 190]AKT51625.1 hypothetical protein ADJ73_10525 [Arsenicicoccus sp. oral taxon 190]
MTDHLCDHLLSRAADRPDATALRDLATETAQEWTYADLTAQVGQVCHALIACGLHPGDAVAIVSDNRAEWLIAELGILAASGVVVHLGPATPTEELAIILRETEARVAFVSGGVLVDQLTRVTGRLPSLRVVISFDEGPGVSPLLDDQAVLAMGSAVDELGVEVGTHGTFSWPRLLAAPFDIATAAEAQRRRDAWGPDDIAFIDYTVGGAGELRGVVLTHRSTLLTVRAIAEAFRVEDPLHEVATLPLHHGLQHGSSVLALMSGGSVTLVRDLETVGTALRQVRPTLLMTTMPVLRRLVEEATRRAAAHLPLGSSLVPWCLDAVRRDGLRGAQTRSPSPADRVRTAVAQSVLGRHVAEHLGGPKDVFVVAGTGALPELLHLLELAGLPPHRGWSTLESGALATTNAPGAIRAGSVGRPLGSLEVAIDPDGQVLLRGAGIMRGYFGLPAVTQRVLADGWLHTGQIGRLDADGYLHLTSRLDDMIVTDSLRYVAPQLVESRLRGLPVVADVVVVGHGRPCLAAIVEPDLELARHIRVVGGDPSPASPEELVTDPLVVRAVGDAVRLANSTLSQEQRVRAFRLTATRLEELGSAGASSFVRRQRLERECSDVIDELYAQLATDDPDRRRPSGGRSSGSRSSGGRTSSGRSSGGRTSSSRSAGSR